MDPVKKAEWLKALRSGEYQQGMRRLRNIHNKYCCLGVLADICDVSWQRRDRDSPAYYFDESFRIGALPRKMLQDLGLSQAQQGELIRLNDEGNTFTQIADWIEKEL